MSSTDNNIAGIQVICPYCNKAMEVISLDSPSSTGYFATQIERSYLVCKECEVSVVADQEYGWGFHSIRIFSGSWQDGVSFRWFVERYVPDEPPQHYSLYERWQHRRYVKRLKRYPKEPPGPTSEQITEAVRQKAEENKRLSKSE